MPAILSSRHKPGHGRHSTWPILRQYVTPGPADQSQLMQRVAAAPNALTFTGKWNVNRKPEGSSDRCEEISSVTWKAVSTEEPRRGENMPEYPGLEQWILVRKIGDGAFGSVYHAKDSQNEKPDSAIKVIQKCETDPSQVCFSHSVF